MYVNFKEPRDFMGGKPNKKFKIMKIFLQNKPFLL